jgi:SAM-dependent methyltransferase
MNQLRKHYQIEKSLASKLKNSNKEERKHLYTELYNELYTKIPDHPQLILKDEMIARSTYVQMSILKPFINNKVTFLEIGPGDCRLSFEIAKYVDKVIAIDVSDEITKSNSSVQPSNFELVISDGSCINVQPGSINVAYSNQLMEHLHPEDAFVQLNNIYKSLAPGGVYICITPHRFSGPHDISKYFDEIATGFHLKEYTYSELYSIFKKIGFSRIEAIVGVKGVFMKVPQRPLILLENMLGTLPKTIKKATFHILLKPIFGIRIIATK